jgi:hypothetical protein
VVKGEKSRNNNVVGSGDFKKDLGFYSEQKRMFLE